MTVGSSSDGAQYLLKVTSNLSWVGDCPLKQKLRNGNSSAPGVLEFQCKVSGFFACPNLGTVSELARGSLSSQLPTSLHHTWKRSFKLDPYKLLALLLWPTAAITKAPAQPMSKAEIQSASVFHQGCSVGASFLWAHPEAPESCQPRAASHGAPAWLTFWKMWSAWLSEGLWYLSPQLKKGTSLQGWQYLRLPH